jgi:hexosaminidase
MFPFRPITTPLIPHMKIPPRLRCRQIAICLGSFLMTGFASSAEPAGPAALIPLPASVTAIEGGFSLGPETVISVAESELDTARTLAAAIERSTGIKASVRPELKPSPGNHSIVLHLDGSDASLGDEGYKLEVTTDSVSITAAKSGGLFYGMQTLRQMLPLGPVAGQNNYPLACVSIKDAPRFAWRGYMLDSARHFISKNTILSLLDALAMAKINVFHWHLTDDEAWRLPISKYPRLVEPPVAMIGGSTQAMGHYSASDVREIVERAKQLHITIVPEIEMPGHSIHAVSVLPDAACLGEDGKPLPPGATREFCLGSDPAITALQDILVETMALFPNSPHIHLGGDEASDEHWKACSRCQARMKQIGLTDPRLLQKWFMEKMNRFVLEQGRTSIAWADRLQLGIPNEQIVHGWHAGELEEAVAKGFKAIQSQHDYTYLDYGQGFGDSYGVNATLETARVYDLDPVKGLTPEQSKRVLGTQAQLWTELTTDDRVFVKTFPRILALAEVGWTPQEMRDGAEFFRRLQAFLPRLDALGIPYFKPSVRLGNWTPEAMSETSKDWDLNVTAHIKQAGPMDVALIYQRGQHGLQIQSVALLEDDREIDRDEHLGSTGASHEKNTYHLRISAVKAGATYTLRTRLRTTGGTDSFGDVLLTTGTSASGANPDK